MNTEIVKASINEKSILAKLLELYAYDLSKYNLADLNEHALYGYKRLDYYWNEPYRYPYIFKTDGNYSGFALIRSENIKGRTITAVAEFFILRKYRKRGIGKTMANTIIKMFPGIWNISVLDCNKPAIAFWERVINELMPGKYQILKDENWNGPTFEFEISVL